MAQPVNGLPPATAERQSQNVAYISGGRLLIWTGKSYFSQVNLNDLSSFTTSSDLQQRLGNYVLRSIFNQRTDSLKGVTAKLDRSNTYIAGSVFQYPDAPNETTAVGNKGVGITTATDGGYSANKSNTGQYGVLQPYQMLLGDNTNQFYALTTGLTWDYTQYVSGKKQTLRPSPFLGGTNVTNYLPGASGTLARLEDLAGYGTKTQQDANTTAIMSKQDTTGSDINAKRDYGAKGDAQKSVNASTTAGSTTVLIPGITTAAVGKVIGIAYAGPGSTNGQTLVTTITAVLGTGTATLAIAPSKTIVGPRTLTGLSMALGSNTLTVADGTATQSDVGKALSIQGAGNADSTLNVHVVQFISSTQLLVSEWALTTISGKSGVIEGATAVWGSDDTAPLQQAINYAQLRRKQLTVSNGRYLTTAALTVKSNINIQGAGVGNTIVTPAGAGFAAIASNYGNNKDSTRTNFALENIEFDGSVLRASAYSTGMKGLFIRPARRVYINHTYFHDFPATAIGLDYLQDAVIKNNVVNHNGVQGWEYQTGALIAGSSGIGIGFGPDPVTRLVINGCTGTENGNNGIFVERQEQGIQATGAIISNNVMQWSHNSGFGDFGGSGVIVSNNTAIYNTYGINADDIVTDGLRPFTADYNYSGNTLKNNLIGIRVIGKQMGGNISNNTVIADANIQGTYGILALTRDSLGISNTLNINGNTIRGVKSNGIQLDRFNTLSSFTAVNISGNTIYNSGSSAATAFATLIAAPVTNLFVKNNIAFDNRTTRYQSYGLAIGSFAIGKLEIGGNAYSGNLTGTELINGTVTTTIRQPTYEATATWTGPQSFTNGNAAVSTFTRNTAGSNVSLQIGNATQSVNFGMTSAGNPAIKADANLVVAPLLQLDRTSGILRLGGSGYATANAGLYFANSSGDVGMYSFNGIAKMSTTGAPSAAVANTDYLAPNAIQNATINLKSVSGNYTVLSTDFVVGKLPVLDLYVDASGGPATVTLLSATTYAGYTIYITKTDNTTNAITVNTVQGSNTLTVQDQVRQFNSNNNVWRNH